MPATFPLDTASNTVRSRASGVLTAGDMIAHLTSMQRLFKDGTLDESWSQLADFTDVTELKIDAGTIRYMVDFNPWPKACRRALVVPDQLLYGFARMYQAMGDADAVNVKVFGEREKAEKWLQACS